MQSKQSVATLPAPLLEGLAQPNKLGIDVKTKDARRLRSRLAKLRSTVEVSDGGAYRECPDHAQIHIVTTMTEGQLDGWLYNVKHGCDWVGVFNL